MIRVESVSIDEFHLTLTDFLTLTPTRPHAYTLDLVEISAGKMGGEGG